MIAEIFFFVCDKGHDGIKAITFFVGHILYDVADLLLGNIMGEKKILSRGQQGGSETEIHWTGQIHGSLKEGKVS